MKLKCKWILMGILLLFCYNFNYFADIIFNDWIVLLIVKCMNSGIFGYLVGYSALKAYLYEKGNCYEL